MDTVSIHTVYVAITDFPEFCLWLRRALKATYGMFSRHPFTCNVTIPAEFKGSSGNLIIGLFNVAGKLHVRNVRITKLD